MWRQLDIGKLQLKLAGKAKKNNGKPGSKKPDKKADPKKDDDKNDDIEKATRIMSRPVILKTLVTLIIGIILIFFITFINANILFLNPSSNVTI